MAAPNWSDRASAACLDTHVSIWIASLPTGGARTKEGGRLDRSAGAREGGSDATKRLSDAWSGSALTWWIVVEGSDWCILKTQGFASLNEQVNMPRDVLGLFTSTW